MKHTKKGFTLVELLVVIAILAILATVSVVGYTAYIGRANESVAMQEAQPYKQLIENELTFKSSISVGTAGSAKLTAEKSGSSVVIKSGSEITADSTDVTLDTTTMGTENPSGSFKVVKDGEKFYLTYTTANGNGTYQLFEVQNPTT